MPAAFARVYDTAGVVARAVRAARYGLSGISDH
jgi:hypothetical protein